MDRVGMYTNRMLRTECFVLSSQPVLLKRYRIEISITVSFTVNIQLYRTVLQFSAYIVIIFYK